MQVGNQRAPASDNKTSQHGARCLEPRRAGANLNGMVGALCIALVLSLATVVRGDFRVKFEVEVRSGTKEFTVLVHEDWAPSMPPTARTPDRRQGPMQVLLCHSHVGALLDSWRGAVQGAGRGQVLRRHPLLPRHPGLHGAVWPQRRPSSLGRLARSYHQRRASQGLEQARLNSMF